MDAMICNGGDEIWALSLLKLSRLAINERGEMVDSIYLD